MLEDRILIGDNTKILLIGGELYKTTGYANALKDIARNLAAIGEDILMLPYSPRVPTFQRREIAWGGATIQPKHFSTRVTWSALLNLRKDAIRNRRYLTGGTIHRLRSLLNYSYTKQYTIQLVKTYEPSIVHIHGFALELLPFFDAVIELDVPFVGTAHGLYSFDQGIDLWFDRSLEKDLFTLVANEGYPITVVSSRVKEQAAQGFGIPEEEVHVVLNGVDTDRFNVATPEERKALREKHGIAPDKTIIITVASIQKRKNQIAILEAFSEMEEGKRRNLLFLVVGGGDPRLLQEYAATHSLTENLRIAGKVSDGDLLDYYRLADIFTLTSTSEGFGLVFLEAMAVGLPIVTFADMEIVKEIFDKDTMILSQSRNPNSLASAILESTEREWDKKGIRQRAESWSWKAICEQYLRVYEIAIAHGKKSK